MNTPGGGPERLPRIAHGLRALAVLIAVAGVIDPAMTRARPTAAVVAVLASGSAEDSLAAAAVGARLTAAGLEVVGVAAAHDAARVVIGAALPPADTARVPTFVYAPAAVALTAVEVPARVALRSSVPISVSLAARRAGTVTVELLDGGVVVSRVRVPLTPGATATRTLTWAPPSLGTHALTVRVAATGAAADAAPSRVTRAVLVDAARWRVLAYDARPSWSATFVRRALERDGRFEVRSRVVTVRAPQALVSRATPRAPASLAALEARAADVLLIGAPEALPASERAALRRLVAEEGVPALLLPDEATPDLAAWLETGGWRTTPRRDPVLLRRPGAGDSVPAALRALVVAAPTALPAGGVALLQLGAQPVVWRQPIGMGEVVVSGALDAWRFRDPAQSAFASFWRDLVATTAARRAPALTVEPAAFTLQPGERVPLRVTARSAPTVTWRDDRGIARSLAVSPTTQPETWRVITPPSAAAHGRVVLVAAGDSLVVPWVVASGAAPDTAVEPPVSAAWALALGGQVIERLDALVPAVQQAGVGRAEPRPWHPMRSGWWIVPFTLALAGDWWLRRRRGWR